MHLNRAHLVFMAFITNALGANHIVKVGMDANGNSADAYSAPVITAAKGDTVTFQWAQPEHRVVQSLENDPCKPMSGGFFSPVITSDSKEFVVTINDTTPIWYYCSEFNHCNLGMAGTINGDMSSYKAYVNAAQSASIVPPASASQSAGGAVKQISTKSKSGGSGSGGGCSSGYCYGSGGGAATFSVGSGAIVFAVVGLCALLF